MKRLAAAALLAVIVSACSNGGGGGGGGAPAGAVIVACDEAAAPATVLWDRAAAETMLPIPSDFFTRPDPSTPTGLRLDAAVGEKLSPQNLFARKVRFALDDLESLDGWGTTASLVAKLSAPLDLPASGGEPEGTTFERARPRSYLAPEDAAVFILNIDRDSPDYGERRGVLADQLPDGTLALEPVPPLAPATRYALVMTRALVADSGGCAQRSDAYDRALSGAPPATDLEAEAGSFARTSAEAVLRADPLLGLDDLVLAEAFTTQTTYPELLEVLDAVDATPLPEIAPGTMTVETLADGPLAAKVRGEFLSPDYRGGNKLWERDGSGRFRKKGDVAIKFVLQIPREGAGGRSQPFPRAIYFHGLSSTPESGEPGARGLYERGVATIGIAAVGHRGDALTFGQIELFNLIGVGLKLPNAISVIRDNLRQSAVDHYQTLRLARGLAESGFDAVAPLGTPDLDPDAPVGAIGISLGGIMGTTLCAVAPEVRYAALYVGGGAVSKIILESENFAELQGTIFGLLFGDSDLPEADRIVTFSAVQTLIERGDPANYARGLYRAPIRGEAKSVLFVEAVHDEVVPNGATELLMRAMGAPSLSPDIGPVTAVEEGPALPVRENIAPGVTAGYYRFAEYHREADGPVVPASHGPTATAVEPVLQCGRFVDTFLETGAAEIESPVD